MGYTEKMEDALYQSWDKFDEYDEDCQVLIESLNEPGFFRTFGEGLLVFLQQKNPELTMDSAYKYIENLCLEMDIPKNEIGCTNTIKDWFAKGVQPRKKDDTRRSVFALAFLLKLSPIETADLFHKVYLDRAFDFRNENEIIFYYCLNNNLSWADANRIIDKASHLEISEDDGTICTLQLKTDIDCFNDEDKLLNYIIKHGHNLRKKNFSAQKNVSDLIASAKITIEEETKLIAQREKAKANKKSIEEASLYSSDIEIFRNTNTQSLNHLYEVITRCNVRGEKGTKTLFKNSLLPTEIKKRFPEAITLSKKDPTYEELRKLIILLASYNYWFHAKKKDLEIKCYKRELDMFLEDSGFSPLYYGNPYDWLFLYCTLADRPLDIFREILIDSLPE